MKDYRVEFSYMEPNWGDILLEDFEDNETEEEIKKVALENIEQSYPEALDVEITLIEEAHGTHRL